MERWTGLLGLALLIGIAFALSEARRRIRWRIVIGGILLQVILALLVLHVPVAIEAFNMLAAVAATVMSFADQGAAYIFGDQLYSKRELGFIFAIHVLPTIIFFASFMAVLYHVGLMQLVVRWLAAVMNRTMGVSGAESLAVAANVFVGQTEAPLVVRPYVERMTRSELMTLMVGGFATIAGGVFAAYVAMLGGDNVEEQIRFAKHLLTASIMSAPAAFVAAKILIPEREKSSTADVVEAEFQKTTANVLDAATVGASDGLRLAANVGAMLLALIALLSGVDYVLEWVGGWPGVRGLCDAIGIAELNLRSILGLLFAPIAWAMGVPGDEARTVGQLLGEKIVLTEFIAYRSLGDLVQAGELSQRSQLIAAYALCGFANFGSVAIQLGGIGGIAPTRRRELAELGFRAMIGGALASFMTATLAGLML